jgi:hypothetical protein
VLVAVLVGCASQEKATQPSEQVVKEEVAVSAY